MFLIWMSFPVLCMFCSSIVVKYKDMGSGTRLYAAGRMEGLIQELDKMY